MPELQAQNKPAYATPQNINTENFPFVAEVLVSAGPRKSVKDYEENPTYSELCEDCAGTCWVDGKLIFWLCDGASNGVILPRLSSQEGQEGKGFSNRIFAQDLGQAFVEYLCQMLPHTKDVTDIDLTATAFTAVATQWKERFAAYISHLEAQGYRDQVIKKLPTVKDKTNLIFWLSTFIGGVFSQQERKVDIINYGYSGALIINETPKVILPNSHPVRVAAAIEAQASLETDVRLSVSNEVKWDSFANVVGFALISDGLDKDNITDLLQNLQNQLPVNLNKLRNELYNNTGLTWDDKAVVFGRFLGA